MYEPFTRERKNRYAAAIDPTLSRILEQLFVKVAELLEEEMPDMSDPLVAMTGISADSGTPDNPALKRLLPEASTDPDVAAEFRRFTDISLRQHKAVNLRKAADSLQAAQPRRPKLLRSTTDTMLSLALDEDGANAWLTATADARLVLAEQLGIETAADAAEFEAWLAGEHHDGEAEKLQQSVVYEVLADMQSSLVQAVSHNL